jgi:hypothetical protein
MKANEFRIGNFIKYKNIAFQCDLEDLIVIRDFEDHHYSYVELNEEWFLKLGFQLENNECEEMNYFWWYLDELEISVFKIANRVSYCYEDNYGISPMIKYVHELQNIYYALFEEEMSIEKTKKERIF